MEKLEGIKPASLTSLGNIGQVWIKQPDGNYKQEGTDRILEAQKIREDFNKGYLKVVA